MLGAVDYQVVIGLVLIAAVVPALFVVVGVLRGKIPWRSTEAREAAKNLLMAFWVVPGLFIAMFLGLKLTGDNTDLGGVVGTLLWAFAGWWLTTHGPLKSG